MLMWKEIDTSVDVSKEKGKWCDKEVPARLKSLYTTTHGLPVFTLNMDWKARVITQTKPNWYDTYFFCYFATDEFHFEVC